MVDQEQDDVGEKKKSRGRQPMFPCLECDVSAALECRCYWCRCHGCEKCKAGREYMKCARKRVPSAGMRCSTCKNSKKPQLIEEEPVKHPPPVNEQRQAIIPQNRSSHASFWCEQEKVCEPL